jgi:chromosome segregation ATPase
MSDKITESDGITVDFAKLQQELFDQAMREAQVLSYNFEEMEKRELQAKQRFKETIAEYQEVILKLAEEKNVQEALHKEQIAELETENRRLKIAEETLHEIQLKFLETQIQLNHQKEQEEQHLQNYNKLLLQLEELNAKYEALKLHAQQKLEDAQRLLEKQKEQYTTELVSLRARLVRAESRNQALLQSLEAKDKENKQLFEICQQLMSKFEGKNTPIELDSIKQILQNSMM